LQIISGVGFIGLALALAVGLVALVRGIVLAHDAGRPESCALVALLSAAFINGISETSFVTPRDIGLVSAALVLSLVIWPARYPVAESVPRPARATPRLRAAARRRWSSS
jgi:hypothetical protein